MATGEVVGLVGEDREDTESPGVIYILNRYNKPFCVAINRAIRASDLQSSYYIEKPILILTTVTTP